MHGSARHQGKGVMPDGTTPLFLDGQNRSPLSYMGCSTFSEYTVVAEVSLAKVSPQANHEQVCLLLAWWRPPAWAR